VVNKAILTLQIWKTFSEHLELAIAERKLHKAHRLLTSAGDILSNVLQECIDKADGGATLLLHFWIEQKEVYLEQNRRVSIRILEKTILVRAFHCIVGSETWMPVNRSHLCLQTRS
jgi:hypothetical protein